MKEKYILSFGAGVNSTALLFWLVENNKLLDEVIFADTENENPETYVHIETIKKWCKERDIKFTIVTAGNMMEHYTNKKIIPAKRFRHCTDKFKIRPIYKYLKKTYEKTFFNVYIGIDYGEKHRARLGNKRGRKLIYPLVEQRIDRDGCKRIIEHNNIQVPIKSGCFFCPFQSKGSWNRLLKNHPNLYEQAIIFEETGSRFPEFILSRKLTLRKLRDAINSQKNLSKFLKMEVTDEMENREQCVYCHL